jgi:hypothetical protein
MPWAAGACRSNLTTANPNDLALGDLNGDGYDELVINYINGGLQVASATDVTDFEQGLSFGDLFSGSSTNSVDNPRAFTIADLDRDGRGELALIGLPTFQIYRLVPPTDPDDPSLDLELATSTPFNPSDVASPNWVLQAGQFDADVQDAELVVSYDDGDEIALILAQVDENLNVTFGAPDPNDQATVPFAQATGRLDWFGDADQVVLFASADPDPALFVAEFVGEGSIGFVSTLTVTGVGCPDELSTLVGAWRSGTSTSTCRTPRARRRTWRSRPSWAAVSQTAR